MEEEVSRQLAGIEAATGRLLGTVSALTDGQVREPSQLPGWTRGHVLTHVARNADAMANVLRAARAGREGQMYPSRGDRDSAIEAGAGRAAAALAADVRDSAAEFASEAALMTADAWARHGRALDGPPFPLSRLLIRRLGEVEIHHSDLGLAYRPGDWPTDFAAAYLPRVARSWAAREDAPPGRLCPAGTGASFPVGPAAAAAAGPAVWGPAAELLAWLTGRSDGSGLRVTPIGEPLPVLPAWR
jgi:maleylpyruvate isomerase